MKGKQRNVVIITSIAILFLLVLYIGFTFGAKSTTNNTGISDSPTTATKAKPDKAREKVNFVSIEDAISKPLTDADKQEIINNQAEIAKAWDTYISDYRNQALDNNVPESEGSESFSDLYNKARIEINQDFVEPRLNEAINEYYSTRTADDRPSLLEIPRNRAFENIPHFEGKVQFMNINEFGSLKTDYEKRGSYQQKAAFTLDPMYVNIPEHILKQIHVVGFSQYTLTYQEVRVSSISYNDDTQKNEEYNRRNIASYDKAAPYYLVVTIYAKLDNRWYPVPPYYFIVIPKS